MQQSKNLKLYSGLLLLACILQASHAATLSSQSETPAPTYELMCYICEDCAEVTDNTPLELCNGEFFNKHTTTEPPATTIIAETTDDTTITPESTTTKAANTSSSTTAAANTSSSTTAAATTTTKAGTKVPPIPTAPTVGPPQTTPAGPTPPNVGTINTPQSGVLREIGEALPTTELPKAMSLIVDDPSVIYSYHCYRIQKNVNGTMQTERGCSRVTAMQSVCGQLQTQNGDTQISHCRPCTNSRCNSSSALTVSFVALTFALVAALLGRK